METESKPQVAGVADLGRTPVTLGVVVLISLTITGIMSGVALTVWGEVTYTRTRLDQSLTEQRALTERVLTEVKDLRSEVKELRAELRAQ